MKKSEGFFGNICFDDKLIDHLMFFDVSDSLSQQKTKVYVHTVLWKLHTSVGVKIKYRKIKQ